MAILKIARMGHPVLAERAAIVPDPTAPEILHLVVNMLETLKDIGGVGLAAPQVHEALRIIIFHVPPARMAAERYRTAGLDEDDEGVPMTVLVNPEIELLGDETENDWESCLSVPGLSGLVPRFARILYRGFGLDGAAIERTAEGFHARVVQHECDHLDGILYPRRIIDLSCFGFDEEIRRRRETADEITEQEDS